MTRKRWSVVIGAALLGFCLTPARARPLADPIQADGCLRSGYEVFTLETPVPLPDGERAGFAIGPLRISDQIPGEGLVVRVHMRHPNTADVSLGLSYDVNDDGMSVVTVPLEIYRARADACVSSEPFSYPIALDGEYYFRDDAPDAADAIFAAFRHLRGGGAFYLMAADSAAQDVGVILDWSVYVKRSAAISVQAGRE